MPVTLTFQHPINTSVQVGDDIFYLPVSSLPTGGFTTTQSATPVILGPCTQVNNPDANGIYSVVSSANFAPPAGSFVMFGKDPRVNTSGLKGYFAELTFKNSASTGEKVELFSVSSEVTESSK